MPLLITNKSIVYLFVNKANCLNTSQIKQSKYNIQEVILLNFLYTLDPKVNVFKLRPQIKFRLTFKLPT